jgi:hypothetical protein
MKIQAKRLGHMLSAGIILAMSLPPLAVWADDAGTVKSEVQLQSEQAAEDKTTPPIDRPKKLLNGQVSKERAGEGVPDPNLGSSQAVPQMELRDAMKLFNSLIQSGQNQDHPNLQDAIRGLRAYRLTINGRNVLSRGGVIDLRSQRPKLSSEEYRKMEYGVIGLEAVMPLNGSGLAVNGVFPTCPCANAGIRPGDLVVKANNYVFQPGDGQRVLWKMVGGKADTPVDVTVLRNAELITFHLMRMNIEDIKDDGIRETFEALLSALGPPDAGTSSAPAGANIDRQTDNPIPALH